MAKKWDKNTRIKIHQKVKRLTREGRSISQICEEMGISPGTVNRFRSEEPPAEPDRCDSEILVDLVLNSDLDDTRKVKLIRNLWGMP